MLAGYNGDLGRVRLCVEKANTYVAVALLTALGAKQTRVAALLEFHEPDSRMGASSAGASRGCDVSGFVCRKAMLRWIGERHAACCPFVEMINIVLEV